MFHGQSQHQIEPNFFTPNAVGSQKSGRFVFVECEEIEKMTRELHPDSDSIGFLLRQIAEVVQLFAKNIYTYKS